MNRPITHLVTLMTVLFAVLLMAAPAALAKSGKERGTHGERYEDEWHGGDKAPGDNHGNHGKGDKRHRSARAVESGELEQWWQGLPDQERQRLMHDYERYRKLDPARRDRVRDRWQRFRDLPPVEQEKLRSHYQRWQEMPPAERERLQGTWRRYQELPAEQRERLKQELRALRELPRDEREHRRLELQRRYFPDTSPR